MGALSLNCLASLDVPPPILIMRVAGLRFYGMKNHLRGRRAVAKSSITSPFSRVDLGLESKPVTSSGHKQRSYQAFGIASSVLSRVKAKKLTV